MFKNYDNVDENEKLPALENDSWDVSFSPSNFLDIARTAFTAATANEI